MEKVEFTLWTVERDTAQDIVQVYDSMLDVSRAFVAEWEEMLEMQAFRGGTIWAHGLQIKYIRDDGFSRMVWVQIDAPEEF